MRFNGWRLYWATQLTLAAALALQVLLYLASPFKTIHPVFPVWLALACFLAVFAVASRLTLGGALKEPRPDAEKWVTRMTSEQLIVRLIAVAAAGLCLHVYAKYYLVRFRPISCIFEIRFAWLEVSHALLPWYVRIASMLGHLLSSFSYFGAFIASLATMRAFERSQARMRCSLYLIIFLLMGLIYAGFIASRDAMLAYCVMAVGGALLGLALGQNNWKQALGAAAVPVMLAFLCTVGFSTAVFMNRIYCDNIPQLSSLMVGVPNAPGNVPTETATEAAIENAPVMYEEGYCREFAIACHPSGTWSKQLTRLCPPCMPTMLYINHGVINFSQIWAADKRGAPVLFEFFRNIPRRLGFSSNNPSPFLHSRIYGPGGTTLAGGAYHDYGITGMLLTACVLGIIYGFALRLIDIGGRLAWPGIWLYIVCFYIMIMSGMFVGSNVMPFPFIAFAPAAAMAVIAWKKKRDPVITLSFA